MRVGVWFSSRLYYPFSKGPGQHIIRCLKNKKCENENGRLERLEKKKKEKVGKPKNKKMKSQERKKEGGKKRKDEKKGGMKEEK